MNNRELKKMLVEQLDLQEHMVCVIEECFKEIFKDDYKKATCDFNDYLESWDDNRWLPDPEAIRRLWNHREKENEKLKEGR